MQPTVHFGVYGMWRQGGRLVLVRKSRGPYLGLLDLPGGAPEPGESEVETLRRELGEECGVRLTGIRRSHRFALHVTRDSAGAPIDFAHRGLIAEVEVAGAVDLGIRAEDVGGVVLAGADDAASLSPLAAEGVRRFPHLALR